MCSLCYCPIQNSSTFSQTITIHCPCPFFSDLPYYQWGFLFSTVHGSFLRILGPQGLSVKQLEAETDCTIVIRGDGSVKCPLKQQRLRGQPGWEHLEEPLHVLITATGTTRRSCENKLLTAVKIVGKLLKPGDDEYKKKQLVQLAIIRGTYRPNNKYYDKH